MENYQGEHFVVFSPVTLDQVKKYVLNAAAKSCELDPLPAWLLRASLEALLPILTGIVNSSLQSGVFPQELKNALVRPLIKKQGLPLTDLKNFRPGSNLHFLGKLIEYAVSDQFEKHLSVSGLHEELQSAYKRFHSTETALIKVQGDIMDSLDKGKITTLVLLDLFSAFDLVDHQKLLSRLSGLFGLSDMVLAWFSSYLSDRSQEVVVDGAHSKPYMCEFGVPQGSVLGPRLFAAYTQPLGNIISKHKLGHHFFADDSQIYLSFQYGDTYQQELHRVEKCISGVQCWMLNNLLQPNSEKTELIVFAPKKKLPSSNQFFLKIGDTTILPRDKVCNLGVWYDPNLSMEKHVHHVSRTCHMHLHNIGRIRRFLTADAVKILVHALIMSQLDYANALLLSASDYLIARLQRIQNAAARLITRTPRREHVTPDLINLHWLPVRNRIEYKILTHVYRLVHGLSPGYLSEMLPAYSPGRQLRSANGMFLQTRVSKTVTYGDKSFRTAAPKMWNSLPLCLKVQPSIDCFKKSLKTNLFKNCYGL